MAPITASFSNSYRWSLVRRNVPLLVVYGMVVILVLYGMRSSDRFWTERNIYNVLRQSAFLGMVALGQTLVILTGGIDLSVGSVVKLSVLVSAVLMDGNPDNLEKALVLTLGLGVLVGISHALVITKLRVAPFIVTLGTFSILRGAALMIATGPVGRSTRDFLLLYERQFHGVPVLVLFFFALLLLLFFVLRYTTFGRYLYAVGGNEQVARLSGIRVDAVKFGAYILCSVLAAVTGLMWLSRMGVGDPVIAEGLELQSITAVILGGTSLFGGRGGVIGTLGGVLLLGLTANLLVVLNVNQWIQGLIQGLIIIAAVALYRQEGRR
jgi:ribose/xylose/arabinose/galactoside ABC-type transport system permease subunit